MKTLTRYLGIGIFCLIAWAGCKENRKRVNNMPVAEIIKREELVEVITDKISGRKLSEINYHVEGKKLVDSFGDYIESDNKNCISRLGPIPRRTTVCVFGNKVHIEYLNKNILGDLRISANDYPLNSEKIRYDVDRYYKDKDLLTQAGLIREGK